MNPGNGIETERAFARGFDPDNFLLMNPGNGIETLTYWAYQLRLNHFLLMNPGNGIETDNMHAGNRKHAAISY